MQLAIDRDVRLRQGEAPRQVAIAGRSDRAGQVDQEGKTGGGAGRGQRTPGSATWKVAPWSAFGVAQRRPPCPSMMERLIDNLMPRPPGVVV
jgi:hypothetical protein